MHQRNPETAATQHHESHDHQGRRDRVVDHHRYPLPHWCFYPLPVLAALAACSSFAAGFSASRVLALVVAVGGSAAHYAAGRAARVRWFLLFELGLIASVVVTPLLAFPE